MVIICASSDAAIQQFDCLNGQIIDAVKARSMPNCPSYRDQDVVSSMSTSKTCPLKKSAKVFARRSISVCGAEGDCGCAISAALTGDTVCVATGAEGLIDGGVLASRASSNGACGVGFVGAGAGADVA